MRRPLTLICIVQLSASPALALAKSATSSEDVVDIRAFGDSGYIGGLGIYGTPQPDWVKTRLAGIESLRSPDINFLNLEGALTRSCSIFLDKPFVFAISPEALLAFGHWGFNLISLSNNHTLDCLDPAPERESAKTLAAVQAILPGLKAHGIAPSLNDLLKKPAMIKVRDVRIGMVSLKAWGNGRRASLGNLDNSRELMAHLAKAPVDVRILSLHGGIENSRRPTTEVYALAREFVAKYNGDIVFGHHPHVSQGIELLTKPNGHTAVVFYSLGNGLHNGLSPKGDGLAARVQVTKKGVVPQSLAVFPLARPAVRPRFMKGAELTEMEATLRDSSAAIALRAPEFKLKRLSFEFKPISTPGAGLALVPK